MVSFRNDEGDGGATTSSDRRGSESLGSEALSIRWSADQPIPSFRRNGSNALYVLCLSSKNASTFAPWLL